MTVPSLQRSLADVVAEYDQKLAAIGDAVRTFERAGADLKMAAAVAGEYGDVSIDVGRVYQRDLELCLLKSAWKHVYAGLNIDRLASPNDKDRWKRALENPEPFTIDNIRGTFGKYVLDPRGSILRGLAEVFCGLDQAYKSHEKVKIGVAGLPKRVILPSVGYSSSYGMEKLRAMLNALAVLRGQPLTEYAEFAELDKLHSSFRKLSGVVTIRGLTIKKFGNGNAHVMFDRATLLDVNRALAEFYGDVLPDATEARPEKSRASTAVSKDLQYYPTPPAVVKRVLDRVASWEGRRVLEPSCGCGRFMDELRRRGARPFGVEVDPTRAALTRSRGHSVLTANFLETQPSPEFDDVVMNPPFYGAHYAKHVRHAMGFLKPGGRLLAVLPVTAREHRLLDDLLPLPQWSDPFDDLPVGSFSESGTNINTTVLTVRKAEAPADRRAAAEECA